MSDRGPATPAEATAANVAGAAESAPEGPHTHLLAVTVALLAVAALLLLVAGGRTWASDLVRANIGGVFTRVREHASGHSITGVPSAAGIVALAGIAAVAATRGRGRWVLGGVLAVVGAAALVSSVWHGLAPPRGLSSNGWPAVAAVGGLAQLGAGLLLVRHGRGWPGLGRRFDATTAPKSRPVGLWEAIERGQDPTQPPEG